MPPRQMISPQCRAALFDPPTDPASIVRHYTLSPEDLALIGQRRRDANRLGFALHLAYMRFPGRVLPANEMPPADILIFVAHQLGLDARIFADYASREATRWEHLSELQVYLKVRPFGRQDYRVVAKAALEESTGTDRGEAIITAMIAYLREHHILLPAATVLERIGLAARALARKQAHKALIADISEECRSALERLLRVDENVGRTPLAWLREWSEAPVQKNLVGIVERLRTSSGMAGRPGLLG